MAEELLFTSFFTHFFFIPSILSNNLVFQIAAKNVPKIVIPTQNPPAPPIRNPTIPCKITSIAPDVAIIFVIEKYNPPIIVPANPPIPINAIPPKHLNH